MPTKDPSFFYLATLPPASILHYPSGLVCFVILLCSELHFEELRSGFIVLADDEDLEFRAQAAGFAKHKGFLNPRSFKENPKPYKPKAQ